MNNPTPESLAFHRALETEGDRSPCQLDPLLLAEAAIDEAWFLKVMRMTALRFAKLDPVEKRNYARRARQLAKVFGEKADMMTRNSRPEPELPQMLRRAGAV